MRQRLAAGDRKKSKRQSESQLQGDLKRRTQRPCCYDTQLCGNCSKALQKPLVCARCKTATYCSQDCQVTENGGAWQQRLSSNYSNAHTNTKGHMNCSAVRRWRAFAPPSGSPKRTVTRSVDTHKLAEKYVIVLMEPGDFDQDPTSSRAGLMTRLMPANSPITVRTWRSMPSTPADGTRAGPLASSERGAHDDRRLRHLRLGPRAGPSVTFDRSAHGGRRPRPLRMGPRAGPWAISVSSRG